MGIAISVRSQGSHANGAGVGAVTDGKRQAVLGDEFVGGGFVVDRQRGHFDAEAGEAVQESLERAQLGVAVQVPCPAVEQDHAAVAGQVVWQAKSVPAGQGDSERRERIAGVQVLCLAHVR